MTKKLTNLLTPKQIEDIMSKGEGFPPYFNPSNKLKKDLEKYILEYQTQRRELTELYPAYRKNIEIYTQDMIKIIKDINPQIFDKYNPFFNQRNSVFKHKFQEIDKNEIEMKIETLEIIIKNRGWKIEYGIIDENQIRYKIASKE